MTDRTKPKLDQLKQLLARAIRPDFQGVLTAPTQIIGVGSSGSDVVLILFRKLQKWLGNLPENVKFLLIDADKDPRRNNLAERSRIVFIPTSKSGAGTNTFLGKKLALLRYNHILTTIERSMVGLMEVDDFRFPTNLPGSELQAALVVSGASGGTGGGTADVAISSIHHAAHRIGLKQVEVNLATIGPIMPTSDTTRSIEPKRVKRIHANAADNYQAWYSQMNTRRRFEERPPGQDPFSIDSSTRIYSKIEFENQSESTRLHRNVDLHRMIAACLLMRVFTIAGKERESRYVDEFMNGTSGQINSATAERID
jgi:hypothetical protein